MHDHHDIEQLLKPLRGMSLSQSEKERTRVFLEEYIAFRPARRSPTRSPLTVLSYPWLHPVPFLAALMLVVTTTSAAFASEGALPGDLLYPVKVHVTEEARAALARTPEKRADWAIERAERRIAEAAQLAAEDMLEESARVELAERAEQHLATAESTLPHESVESGQATHTDEREVLRERMRLAHDANERIVRRIPVRVAAAPVLVARKEGRVAVRAAEPILQGEAEALPVATMAFSTELEGASATPTVSTFDTVSTAEAPQALEPELPLTPEVRGEAVRRALNPRLETAERAVRRVERVLGEDRKELRTIVSEAREERDRAEEATTTEERLIRTERAHERALRAIERAQELAREHREKQERETTE